ncbi:MAG: ParB/RepB/Spo0J family partition protein [Candidatus Heimdallarchaeota archaeon]
MEKMKIDKIKKKENIREDYGDLTELTESIRVHGVRHPIELNSNNEIIDGHRRFVAAKAAGLNEVPFFYADSKIDETTSQLIAGIFQKNLNPVEEGKAFQLYMDKTSITSDYLARQISKKVGYVDKRLELAKLPIKIQTALIKKKIQMGHALLLARLPEAEAPKFMRRIINSDMSVNDAKDRMSYGNPNLKEAGFCKRDCKNCQYNGSKQGELFETGTILSGNCMNEKCFMRKLGEFIKQKRKEYADVLYESESDYSPPKGFAARDIWEARNSNMTDAYMKKCKDKRENYLVRVADGGKITEFFKIPSKKGDTGSVDEETQLERKEQGLLVKVNEFKNKFLIDETKKVVNPNNSKTKALSVIRLINESNYSERHDLGEEQQKFIGDFGMADVKQILAATESELDKVISEISKNALKKLGLKDLVKVSRSFCIDVKTHFEITEEYLTMYTRDQLKALIEELKLKPVETELKKGELIEHILSQELKGKVPKLIQ